MSRSTTSLPASQEATDETESDYGQESELFTFTGKRLGESEISGERSQKRSKLHATSGETQDRHLRGDEKRESRHPTRGYDEDGVEEPHREQVQTNAEAIEENITPLVRNGGEDYAESANGDQKEPMSQKNQELASKKFKFFPFHVDMLRSLYKQGSPDECSLGESKPGDTLDQIVPLDKVWESVDNYLKQRLKAQKVCHLAKHQVANYEDTLAFIPKEKNGLKLSIPQQDQDQFEVPWENSTDAAPTGSGASCCGNSVSTIGTAASMAMMSRVPMFRQVRQSQFPMASQYSPSPYKPRGASPYQTPLMSVSPCKEPTPPLSNPLAVAALVQNRRAHLAQKEAHKRTAPLEPLVIAIRHRLDRLELVSKALGLGVKSGKSSDKRTRLHEELTNQTHAKIQLWRMLLTDLERIVKVADTPEECGGKK